MFGRVGKPPDGGALARSPRLECGRSAGCSFQLNDIQAEHHRARLAEHGILAIPPMFSPGAGVTRLIEECLLPWQERMAYRGPDEPACHDVGSGVRRLETVRLRSKAKDLYVSQCPGNVPQFVP